MAGDDVYELFQLFVNMLVAANPWRRRLPPPGAGDSTPPPHPPSPDPPAASRLGHAKRATLREFHAYRSSLVRRPHLRLPEHHPAEIHQ